MVRIYVEKKNGFNLEAKEVLKELSTYLKIPNLENIRILNRYDIDYMNEEIFEQSKYSIFAEKNTENVYNSIIDTNYDFVITLEFLPGQYDQRADFLSQSLHLLSYSEKKPIVKTSKVFLFYGKLDEESKAKIKSYLINPIECRESSVEIPASLEMDYKDPEKIKVIEEFNTLAKPQLEQIGKDYNLGMSIDNLLFSQNYFKKEGKNPTITEMRILDAYWSDHCRHSTFNTIINDIKIEKDDFGNEINKAYERYLKAKNYVYAEEKPTCLMDIAVMGMKKLKKEGKLNDLEPSNEVNACSIVVQAEVDGKLEDWLIMFKNETHNHPTEMEPFGGASTCIGGGIRDPLSGRSYVYGAMRVTGCADPRMPYEETLKGKLPQRKLTRTAAEGYSSYSNQIGLASTHLSEIYDEGYVAKRMECGALIGAVKRSHVIRKEAEVGDVIVLLGGRTGRDGCGGATGSSKEHHEDSLKQGGAEVQKGNPVIERNIVRLFRKPEVSRVIKKCNDFGAGGVSVAIGEMADSLYIDLDKIKTKYKGLDGTELAISESQERMAVLISRSDLDFFCKEAMEENLEALKIAEVTDSGRMIMVWNGEEIANLSREFLNSGGFRDCTDLIVESPKDKNPNLLSKAVSEDKNIKENWLSNLSDLNVCSKISLADRFDSTVGNATALYPFGGKYQLTPEEGLAMRLPLLKGKTDFGTLMTFGYNPVLSRWSPFHGAIYSVLESITKIVAMGGEYSKIRLSFQEYFEKLSNLKKWGKPFSALLGSYLVQEELNIPSIGGKDSMSGTFEDIDVPPALISFAVNTLNTKNIISRSFKNPGNKLILVYTDKKDNYMPDFDIYKNNMANVHQLILKGCVKASSTVGFGGIAASITQMAFGNMIGVKINDEVNFEELFSPNYTNIILEVDNKADLSLLKYKVIGKTIDEPIICINNTKISLQETLVSWESTLEDIFPPAKAIKKPKVLIPIFPGTNGEYALEKAFCEAGAEVNTFLFKNLNSEMIIKSFEDMAKAIDEAEILAIPSGISGGGDGKLIANIIRNPKVKASINNLVKNRNGLILGLGEGFKALIDTGLIPYGEVCEESDELGITKNKSNRFVSKIVDTKLTSNISPWTYGLSVNEVESAPVASYEGAVYITKNLYEEFLKNGQIAFEYVTNPFGSDYNIESITSKDGRIMGRMALVERMEDGLYVNVTEKNSLNIFKNAVDYIKIH